MISITLRNVEKLGRTHVPGYQVPEEHTKILRYFINNTKIHTKITRLTPQIYNFNVKNPNVEKYITIY